MVSDPLARREPTSDAQRPGVGHRNPFVLARRASTMETAVSDRPVIITDEASGKSLELPVVRGTEGEPTLQIKALPKELGYFTYDPGFIATASCSSAITFIDGDQGILRHRGYPIEQLAKQQGAADATTLFEKRIVIVGAESLQYN